MAAAAGTPRRAFVGGNWKASGTKANISAVLEAVNKCDIPDTTDVVFAPSGIHMESTRTALRKEADVAAQSIHSAEGLGAYTGEVTATMLKEAGIPWTLVGHSERRNIFGETDEAVAAKVKAAHSQGIKVIACVGETLAQREADETTKVVSEQIEAFIPSVARWEDVVIAYEPIWAIGTGKTASAEQAQEVHAAIRALLASKVSSDVAASTRIVYGGSVKGANCKELFAGADVDGFLVGGASLKPEFADIIASTKQ